MEAVTRLCRTIFPILSCVLFLARGAFAQSPVTITIETRFSGYTIPADFAGLSFETGSELPNKNRVRGFLFSPTNKELINLFQNAGIHQLRLGGGTVDGTVAAVPSLTGISNVFAFARAVSNLNIIYSLRLLNGNAASNAASAKYIWENYRPWVAAISIGNEPDWKSYHYPPYGNGSDPVITNYTSYLSRWRRFASAITNAAPGISFAGPDTGDYTGSTHESGKSWTELFAHDEKNSGIVSLITQHYYVGGRPDGITGAGAISNMLSEAWVDSNYQWFYQIYIAPVVADGLSYRLTEANDYLKGVADASNAHASALWALDFLHWWAAHGCAGVDFHNKSWLLTDTIYLDASGHYQANPKACAIKAFELGSRGQVQPLTMANTAHLNLTAYAVGNATNLCVTIINKEHGPDARNALVTLCPTGIAFADVSAMFLNAPDGNLAATNGVTLGGAAIANDAPWQGRWTRLPSLVHGQCTFNVPASSAVVAKIIPVAGPPK